MGILTKEKKVEVFCARSAFLIRMRLTPLLNGKGFGQLYKVRGQTRYHISPMEQRAFAGAISKGVPNVLWRFRSNVAYWSPPSLLSYKIYTECEKEHERLSRKQEGQFD